MSSGLNVTSQAAVTSLTLDGLAHLSDHRWLFFFVLLAAYLFVLFSDSLVVYVICSQRNLHRPMFIFIAAVLLNSLAASAAVYPKLLSDLASGRRFTEVSHAACLGQAFVLYSLGGSSFVLLAAMSFDRYLSICRPLRYAALVSPAAVAALLLLCWLLPTGLVSGATLLASRVPLCRARLSRVYCDIYSFVSLGCGGGGVAAMLLPVYGLLVSVATVVLPVGFVLFSYGRILLVCLRGSRSFSSKALHTCLPHLLVFLIFSLSTGVELLQRRLHSGGEATAASTLAWFLMVAPTVFNPVIYGLRVKEVFRHVRRLLRCRGAG
ncbi:putative olfactory receptor 51E1-like [Scophthalmus maximus]|uniref:Olfactory receptor n=1 Tax=Scophthalmus maximus TaxID=52904 RepID=A0A2U9CAT7_SCOMX|nr:olfactory receptor 11A1-like [Scophthalmus maximus]AWP13717.1 putative olfactory receptor 51E1-like [Scophthalmus maximus]